MSRINDILVGMKDELAKSAQFEQDNIFLYRLDEARKSHVSANYVVLDLLEESFTKYVNRQNDSIAKMNVFVIVPRLGGVTDPNNNLTTVVSEVRNVLLLLKDSANKLIYVDVSRIDYEAQSPVETFGSAVISVEFRFRNDAL